jgi:hypothetical protein
MSQQNTRQPVPKRDGRAQMAAQTKPSTKQDRSKPKWPIWLLIGAGVLLPSLIVVNLFKSNTSPIARVVPVAATQASIAQLGVDAQVNAMAATPTAETTKPVEKMNLMPAENITPNFVDHVGAENGVRIMYFRDGSRRNLDDFTLQQLPEGTRASISYSRGSNANR